MSGLPGEPPRFAWGCHWWARVGTAAAEAPAAATASAPGERREWREWSFECFPFGGGSAHGTNGRHRSTVGPRTAPPARRDAERQAPGAGGWAGASPRRCVPDRGAMCGGSGRREALFCREVQTVSVSDLCRSAHRSVPSLVNNVNPSARPSLAQRHGDAQRRGW